MTTTLTQDVVTLLKQDHEAAKSAFAQFDLQPRDRWGALFHDLSQKLVAHEVAEEGVVYPAIRKLPGGAEMADVRLAEQAEAERKLVSIERLDPMSDTFATEIEELKQAVLAHATAEESGPFDLLEREETAERLAELGKRYTHAKESAPNHPHPNTPHTPPGNLVAGPVTAAFDRVRDKMREFFE